MAVQAQLYSSENLGVPAFGVHWALQQDPAAASGYTDVDAAVPAAAATAFHCFPNQSLPPQFTELIHVGSQDMAFVHRGRERGGFGGGDAPSSVDYSTSISNCSHQSSSMWLFSQSLAAEIDIQTREVDMFLKVQNERLRYAVQQQMGVLLGRLELRAMTMVRDKEQDLAKVRMKTKELEECLRSAETEIEAWQRTAKENEAMVIGLNSMLQQVKHNYPSSIDINGAAAAAEYAQSVCEYDSSSPAPLNSNNCSSRKRGKGVADEGGKRRKSGMGWCRGCHYWGACMVFLPCRHLCSCKSCEGFLQLCPVCHSVKQAIIEVSVVNRHRCIQSM
ncbi:hypothetical protein Dimus_003194 [Dionaea muscipula]